MTWGGGELPIDFLDFYEELDGVALNGKMAAVFGSGETGYNSFCTAVNILMEKLKERGADVYAKEIIVDLTQVKMMKKSAWKNSVMFLNSTVVK